MWFLFYLTLITNAQPLQPSFPSSQLNSKSSEQKTWKKLYQEKYRSVFIIRCGTRRGAGFLYKQKNLLITSLHVAGCGRNIFVKHYSQAKEQKAELVSYIQKYDLALLKIQKPSKEKIFTTDKLEEIHPGKKVAVIGHPYSTEGRLSKEIRSALRWNMSTGTLGRVTKDYIQMNLPNTQGYTGGPIFSQKGSLLGMYTVIGKGKKQLGIIARIHLFKKLSLDKSVRQGYPSTHWKLNFNTRFSFALNDKSNIRFAPANQDIRLELQVWDQLFLGTSVGLEVFWLENDLDLSVSVSIDVAYAILMHRSIRPYINHISLGLGTLLTQVQIATQSVPKDKTNQTPKQISFSPAFRMIAWSGVRVYSLYGQFSLGMYFDPFNIKTPIMSISWGF